MERGGAVNGARRSVNHAPYRSSDLPIYRRQVRLSGSVPCSHRGGQGFKSPQLHRVLAGQVAVRFFWLLGWEPLWEPSRRLRVWLGLHAVAGQGSGQPARTPAPGRCAPVSRMAATSTARKIRNSRSSTSSSIQAITPPRLFPRLLCIQPNSGAGTCPAAPARSPGAAPLHLEPGHLVNATAASAAEANNCRRADLAVIHPRCCHSRSASESPAITTSPNGMER